MRGTGPDFAGRRKLLPHAAHRISRTRALLFRAARQRSQCVVICPVFQRSATNAAPHLEQFDIK
jgi:hypothetical protein